jgi:hypothetical protein
MSKKNKEEKYKDKSSIGNDNDIDERELSNETRNINEFSESYMEDMHYENVHECVVESLNIIKMHIKEKSLRMGQKIEYGDIFDFLFK